MSINVCILGVSGYTGSKLLYYLNKHKDVNIRGVFGNRQVGRKLKDFFPKFENLPDLKISNYKLFNFKDVDLIFSCLPHGEFQKNIISDLDPNISIIDLSGDFRIESKDLYESFYDIDHKQFNLKKKFVYGLPEINRDIIKKAKFIANPGCYPTSILIPLIPLLKNNLINSSHIIIDSKSGVSGAGKKLVEDNLFSELNNNFYPYSIKSHKHFPEINQEIKKISESVSFSFTPHLLPIFSGLQSSIYLEYRDNIEDEVKNTLSKTYDNESFVKLNYDNPTKLSEVQETNNISINVFSDYEKKSLLIISSIDNLVKGAAGQAIQNMNIMYGFKEIESLK